MLTGTVTYITLKNWSFFAVPVEKLTNSIIFYVGAWPAVDKAQYVTDRFLEYGVGGKP